MSELHQFRLEVRHVEHHIEQLLCLHKNASQAFQDLLWRCQLWLEEVVAASFITRCKFGPTIPHSEINQRTEAARLSSRHWEKEIRQYVSLGSSDEYLHHDKPFSTNTFAAITPEELHARVFAFWLCACERLSTRIFTVVANGVDQGPFFLSRGPASLFGLIKVDELNAKATYSYLTRELLCDANVETDASLVTPNSPLRRKKIRHTRTTTERQQRQLVHHSHSLINVRRFGYVDALATSSLAMPPEIEEALRKAPPCLHAFLDVYAGSFALGRTVATDLDVKETVRKSTRDVHLPIEVPAIFPFDPALCLFRNFVICGWGPVEAKAELRRRGQVRLRQMRQRQILGEKQQAEDRHKQEVHEIHTSASRPLYALAVTLLLLLVLAGAFFAVHENSVGLLATYSTLALCLLLYVPSLSYTVWQRARSRARLRSELSALDTEAMRIGAEIETLRNTPVTEL